MIALCDSFAQTLEDPGKRTDRVVENEFAQLQVFNESLVLCPTFTSVLLRHSAEESCVINVRHLKSCGGKSKL